MTVLQLGLVLVASTWAAMNTIIAGYQAVNATRDRVLTGQTGDGVPLTLAHRRIMYRNDWLPMKVGLSAVSLAFAGFLIYLPLLADEPDRLRAVCYAASMLPVGSFLGFFLLGLSDRSLMIATLSEAEAAESRRRQEAPDPETEVEPAAV